MTTYAVEYVDWDEATPRALHTTTVQGADEDAAERAVLVRLLLAGNRIGITRTTSTEEGK